MSLKMWRLECISIKQQLNLNYVSVALAAMTDSIFLEISIVHKQVCILYPKGPDLRILNFEVTLIMFGEGYKLKSSSL
jgi:hypothetical protein